MRSMNFVLLIAVVVLSALAIGTASAGGGGNSWNVKGTYVEGCSCNPPCACELTGLENGCQGVGALKIDGGSYNGTDLAGTKIAYATAAGDWVRLYVDAKNDQQRDAATEFAKMTFKEMGKIESSASAKVDISGKNGKYTLKVDNGKIMQLTTEPIFGGDNKTPITHTNVKNPLNSVFMQAKTISGSFSDGERKFDLKGTNSYFNTHMKGSGEIASTQ